MDERAEAETKAAFLTPLAPRARRSRFGLGAKLAVAAFTVALCLVAAEAGLRVRRARRIAGDPFWGATVRIHRESADPELVYELNPGAEAERDGVAIRINPQGFRDDPFPDPPPAGAPRIVVVGDSVAWGWGVKMEDAFPQALERELAARRPGQPAPVVYNLAVDGYATGQEIRMLETHGIQLARRPDLAVVAYVMNDPDTYDAGLARYYRQRSLELLRPISNAIWRLRHGLGADRLAEERGEDYHQYIHARYREQTRAQFARLGRFSRASGVPILVAVSPVLIFKPGEASRWQNLVDDLRRDCEANGLGFLDLRDRLGAENGDHWTIKREGVAADPWHPNAEGHLEIARALADAIESRGLARPKQ